MAQGMTDDEIRALIEAEVKRHFANVPRIVPKEPKVPNFSEFLKPIEHRPILSNEFKKE
jgi:hypothetical protein